MGLSRFQRSLLLCAVASLAIAQSVWAGKVETGQGQEEKLLTLEGIEEGLQVRLHAKLEKERERERKSVVGVDLMV